MALLVATAAAAVATGRYTLEAGRRAADAEQARHGAEVAAEREIGLRRSAESRLYAARVAVAQLAQGEGDLARAAELLDQCRPAPGEPDLRGWEWHYLVRLVHPEVGRLVPFDGPAFAVAFAPDGRLAAAGGGNLYFRTGGGVVPGDMALRDPAGGERRIGGFAHLVSAVAFDSAGGRVAAGSHDGTVRVYDPADGREVGRVETGGQVTALAFVPGDTRLFVASGNLRQADATGGRLWDWVTGRPARWWATPP